MNGVDYELLNELIVATTWLVGTLIGLALTMALYLGMRIFKEWGE